MAKNSALTLLLAAVLLVGLCSADRLSASNNLFASTTSFGVLPTRVSDMLQRRSLLTASSSSIKYGQPGYGYGYSYGYKYGYSTGYGYYGL